MEKLPNEILDRIIGYFNRKALLSVRLVNKTWQTYAENHLRKATHFSLEIDKDVSDLIRITSWRNENTIPPFTKFKISGILSKGILEEFGMKYGNVIESLKFEVKKIRPDGFPPIPNIDHSNIFELLMKTPNINKIHLLNYWNDVDMKREYQLCLPKLRILELGRMDTSFVKLLLDSSPNIQQVKLGEPGKGSITEDNWKDHITIFQSIATRGIELKLRIWISSRKVNLQRLKEIVNIPFKVTELTLIVGNNNFSIEEWSIVQESIEKLIHNHSKTLKLLIVCLKRTEDHWNWNLNLKNLDNLEALQLLSPDSKETKLQVNIGQTPMLKEVRIGSTELNMESAPLLKSLRIRTNNASEYLKRPELFYVIVRLKKLCLIFREETLTTTESDERVQLLNKLLSQAKNLKVLEIATKNPTGMEELNLPIMEKLQKLLLNLSFGINGKLKLEQSNFPNLKILKLDTTLYENPSLNESLGSVHTLILKSESLRNFRKTILRFPRLKKLHIKGIVTGFLTFVFKNLTHLEELKVESKSGVSWDDLTGYSEDEDFIGEPATSTSNLDTSIPNLGDLIDLKRLHISSAWMDEVKAVAYLISSGKLKNLKYFEGYMNRLRNGSGSPPLVLEQQKFISFVKIIESNNTRTNLTPFLYEVKM